MSSKQAQTVSDARAIIAKASEEFRARLQTRIATEKAKLLLERSSGTLAHIRRMLTHWKSYALIARIEIERAVRKVPRLVALGIVWFALRIWSLVSVDMEEADA